jgi:hypothetical protein
LSLWGAFPPEARARLDSWRSAAARELDERPVRTLCLALGAGYLLGGGLFSRLTWRAARLALRFGLPHMLSLMGEEGSPEEEALSMSSTDGTGVRAPSTKSNLNAPRKRKET